MEGREQFQVRRGPKKMRRADVRSSYVQVGLTAGEKDALNRLGEVRGTSGSSVMRVLLQRYLKQRNIPF